jgi:hypothetical protein
MVHGCVLGSDAAVPPGARLFYVVLAHEQARTSPRRMSLRRTARTAAETASPAGPVLGNRLPGSFLARASNGD